MGGDDEKRLTVTRLHEIMADKLDHITNLMESKEEENVQLNKKMDNLSDSFRNVTNSITEMREKIIENLVQANKDLQDKVIKLEQKVKNLESIETSCEQTNQYGRRNNLEIAGIPNQIRDDQLENNVIGIYKKMNINVIKDDIEACHRLPPPKNSPNNNKKVIVRFVNRKLVEKALKQKKVTDINCPTVYFNPNLNKYFSKLAWRCRRLKSDNVINSFSYKNEAFYVFFNENVNNENDGNNSQEKSKKIISESDLESLFPDYYAAVLD